jgi:hypothetical protein
MRAYEFPAKVAADGRIALPEEILDLVPSDGGIRVIVLVSDEDELEEQAATARLVARQFLAAYGDGDAIYDRL